MSAEPCRVCGVLRKCYQVVSSDGWHQPSCINCGDPGYVEPFEDDEEEECPDTQGLAGDGHPEADDAMQCVGCGVLAVWRDGQPVNAGLFNVPSLCPGYDRPTSHGPFVPRSPAPPVDGHP